MAFLLLEGASAHAPVAATAEIPEARVGLPHNLESALKQLPGARTAVPVQQIEAGSAQYEERPDAFLGQREEEARAQVMTLRWRATVRAEEEECLARTNQTGTAVIMEHSASETQVKSVRRGRDRFG